MQRAAFALVLLLLGCHLALPLEAPVPDAARPPPELGVDDIPTAPPDANTAPDRGAVDLSPPADLLPSGVIVKTYNTITLKPGVASSHFPDLWDLTVCQAARQALGCDLVVRYAVDLAGVTVAGTGNEMWTEVGLREEGEPDFNPDGNGGWLVSFAVNLTSAPDTVDNNDRHTAQSTGGLGEYEYDVHDCTGPAATAPVKDSNPVSTIGFWFDRDGTSAAHASHPLAGDGATYNTKGRYDVRLCFRADGPTSGTLCHTVNGVAPGFYTTSPSSGVPDIYPAGLSFAGEMDDMQVFVGFAAAGSGAGVVVLDNIEVTGCPR